MHQLALHIGAKMSLRSVNAINVGIVIVLEILFTTQDYMLQDCSRHQMSAVIFWSSIQLCDIFYLYLIVVINAHIARLSFASNYNNCI